MSMEDPKKLLARLQRLCVRRECCSADILKKALVAFEGDEVQARAALEALVADRFVDDARYAAAFAREKSSLAGWGAVKIRHALLMKKIPREAVDSALAEIDAGAAEEKLRRLLDSKAKTLEGDPRKRLKLLRFALSRGYEWDDIEKIV